jgi:hypothetical protein
MNSATNPISLIEDAFVAAIKDATVTIAGTDYKPFDDIPARVAVGVGSDEEIIQRLHAAGSALPQAVVRWSGWLSSMERATANVIGYGEQSGTILLDVFFGCSSPRTAIETKKNALGLIGFQDCIIAIIEQIDPMAIGMEAAFRHSVLIGKFQYLYFSRVEKISFSSQSSVLKLNFVAVLNPQT